MHCIWINNKLLPILALLCSCLSVLAAGTSVSYDSSAIIINGERRVIFGVNSRMTLSWKTQMNYCSCFLFKTRLRYQFLYEHTFSQHTLTELTHLSYVIVFHHLHMGITIDIRKSQSNHYLTCVLILTKYVQ